MLPYLLMSTMSHQKDSAKLANLTTPCYEERIVTAEGSMTNRGCFIVMKPG